MFNLIRFHCVNIYIYISVFQARVLSYFLLKMEKDEQVEHKNSACANSTQGNSKLAMLENKFKMQIAKSKAKDLQDSLKLRGWQMLSNSSNRKNGNLM